MGCCLNIFCKFFFRISGEGGVQNISVGGGVTKLFGKMPLHLLYVKLFVFALTLPPHLLAMGSGFSIVDREC